uniref:RNA-dependent RNA polymerase n=1 Tax=Netjeret virus TaxID=2800932 RepID=A0A894KNR7_9VIRU|nr:MAG: RNA-dependent RNA polymerase [Netjeret virus]
MADGSMPKTTSPGLPYIQQKVRTKEEAWVQHQQEILDMHTQIRRGHHVSMPDCAAFARNVVCPADTNKVRLVWAYPLAQVLLEAKYVQPLLNALTNQELGTSIAYGAETYRGGMKWLDKELKSMPMQNYICLDYSSFDQTVPAWLIRIAFDILEECFTDSFFLDTNGYGTTDPVAVEREWRQIRRYFIETPLRMEDGTRYRKTGGIPSGSCFTNIIDSIVNLIVTNYAIRITTGAFPNWITVLGDDSVTATTGVVNLEDIAQVIKMQFGMTVNMKKSYWTERWDNVQFLGYYNMHGFPIRKEEELLAAMLLPDSAVDEEIGITGARFLGIAQASCGAHARVAIIAEKLFYEMRLKGWEVTQDAHKLYHIKKAFGWLPAAGEEPEPLPTVRGLREAILPRETCQKLVKGITRVKMK